jgi:filamentous hemagglutinin
MSFRSQPEQSSRAWPIVSSRQYPDATSAQTALHIDESPAEAIVGRISELREQIPEKARGWITLSIGLAECVRNQRYYVLGTSEPRGYLRPGVRPKPGEIVVSCDPCAHAEITVIAFILQQKGWTVILIGATRPICDDCRDGIDEVRAKEVTELKNERNAGS